ncbi:MAG: restriction endonuclease subunit S [Candidatus Competibacteraceae bacterium]|nr:restriction endonuclease subunit S [Candidatus Competibacteraceae bacterium]HRX71820.1 restriction endonuclease subunit S [Candidatus Competibacteraceae bacterium]
MKFKSFKNARIVRSSWLEEGGRRLDCGPYMSGALEARDTLKSLDAPKEPLKSLTAGYAGGIYNGPMFRRNYVESPEYGVPFVTSGTMLLADLSTLPLLRKRDAESSRLSYLQLKSGMTLISCSGTIGRMAYVRPDMDGMWSSQDVLKVVPDESRIPPGYLYAFLSSKYGVPLVVSGTYGAIIQHIEPAHIADLPVPRFESDFETRVSNLIGMAATQRVLASQKRYQAIQTFQSLIGWEKLTNCLNYRKVSSTDVIRRMDAFYHSPKVAYGAVALSVDNSVRIGDVVDRVFEPNRGSRLKVDDADFGVPFLSSSAVFEVYPEGEYLISKSKTPHIDSLLITSSDVLIPRSGQLGGIIGRAVLPLQDNIGNAASEHLVRVRCRNPQDTAYFWTVLASEPGYWAVVGTAYGSSIPSLDSGLIANIHVPLLDESKRQIIATLACESTKAQSLGIQYEIEAVCLVENMIAEDA